jgi:KaiC/GvpD/RAD55 family RecA-like ATPase
LAVAAAARYKAAMSTTRFSTGIPSLDALLGGGLLPGTLTVVAGATGIGKTQLGIQFARAGLAAESRRGILFDMASRGDSQNHAGYAERLFGWKLVECDYHEQVDLHDFYSAQRTHGEYLHVFDYVGKRVTRRDLEFDDWQAWQAQLNQRLRGAIAFLYGNFVQGCRRVVVDGFEPTDRPSDSIQLNLFEYVYHQVLRKDPEWVARDLFREHYRANADAASRHVYDPAQIACLMLYTTHETMLDDLISKPLSEGDALSNANTLIYLGRVRQENRIGRGLYIAKHRGSACDERVISYTITDAGLAIAEPS